MKNQKPGYQSHLFICTNAPDKSGKCGSKNSEELRRNLKERCHQTFGKKVRINSSGCLGYCENGIAAVLYSEKTSSTGKRCEWFLDLKPTDEEVLYQAVQSTLD